MNDTVKEDIVLLKEYVVTVRGKGTFSLIVNASSEKEAEEKAFNFDYQDMIVESWSPESIAKVEVNE